MPATIVYGSTFSLTTDFAPTIAPSPIVTPFKIVQSNPIQTLSSIVIGLDFTDGAII